MDIYGPYRDSMVRVMEGLAQRIEACCDSYEREHGERLYEHLRQRIKSEESMREKCRRLLMFGRQSRLS